MIKSKATDTAFITQLLQKVENLQVKENGVFPRGLFPSYRTYALNQDRQKADINVFFTGLILFTLEKVKNKLTPFQQNIISTISVKARPATEKFKNLKNRNTYNFWPTDTPMIFPNAGWMNLFNRSQSLPDDLDDTVILLMALSADKTTAEQVHQIMQEYVNGNKRKIKNTLLSVKNFPAYSVWFGQKMPVDFDISVLCNILYFVQYYNLPFSSADSASLLVIEEILKENKHISDAKYVSPHYGDPAIIMYHLARMMSIKPIDKLEIYKPILIQQTNELLQQNNSLLMKVLLSSALLFWNTEPPLLYFNQKKTLNEIIEDESFSFFIANMASMLPNTFKKTLTATTAGKFNYYCPAYNYVLLIENIVLHNQFKH